METKVRSRCQDVLAQDRYADDVEINVALAHADIEMPNYANPGDAGADLRAAEALTIEAGGARALVSTGIVLSIPEGFAAFIQPRSGLALRHGITCLNSPGLIDSGYRGEIKVLLINTDPSEAFEIKVGDRIAQLVIQRVEQARFMQVTHEELSESDRGSGGFGSSGTV